MKTILVFLSITFSGPALFAQQEPGIHDPVMARCGDTYYLFGTGWGISVLSSEDRVHWKQEPPVFKEPPAWTKKVVPSFQGHIWAPDISWYDGQYYLFYSVSAFGKNTSAIGLATNTTLDASDPKYLWQDHGMILQSVPNRDLWNAIDPNLTVDSQGYPWLAFGSFWEGLKMVKLIPNRTAVSQPEEWHTIARRKRSDFLEDADPGDAALEAPFIFKKDSLYYLFASWDYCCRGANSTYKVVVGRAASVNGPYVDKDGISMNAGGGSLVVAGNSRYAGVGHCSAYTFDGQDILVFHAYDSKAQGHSILKIIPLQWDDAGWPVIDPTVLED